MNSSLENKRVSLASAFSRQDSVVKNYEKQLEDLKAKYEARQKMLEAEKRRLDFLKKSPAIVSLMEFRDASESMKVLKEAIVAAKKELDSKIRQYDAEMILRKSYQIQLNEIDVELAARGKVLKFPWRNSNDF